MDFLYKKTPRDSRRVLAVGRAFGLGPDGRIANVAEFVDEGIGDFARSVLDEARRQRVEQAFFCFRLCQCGEGVSLEMRMPRHVFADGVHVLIDQNELALVRRKRLDGGLRTHCLCVNLAHFFLCEDSEMPSLCR